MIHGLGLRDVELELHQENRPAQQQKLLQLPFRPTEMRLMRLIHEYEMNC